MALTWLLRVHSISALLFAVPLLLAPAWLGGLLTGGSETVGMLGVAYGRLFGVCCAMIAVVTWAAVSLDAHARIVVARAMLFTESLGFLVGLFLDFGPDGAPGRWLTLGSYAAFALAYVVVLFVRPESARP